MIFLAYIAKSPRYLTRGRFDYLYFLLFEEHQYATPFPFKPSIAICAIVCLSVAVRI